MKIFKYLFFLLLLFIIAGSIYIGTKNGSYQITEEKVLKAPNELIYQSIIDYSSLSQWNPYQFSKQQFNYTDMELTEVGIWENENKETHKLATQLKIPNTKVKQRLEEPGKDSLHYEQLIWELSNEEEVQTSVKLSIKGELTFKEKLLELFKDQDLTEVKQNIALNGLQKLERHLDTLMNVYDITVSGMTEYGGGFYMYTATAATIEAMPIKLAEMIPMVQAYVSANNIPQTGNAFTIYNDFNPELGTTIFSAAIPIRDRVITPENSAVLCDFLPRQTVVKTILKGDYKFLAKAWEQARTYVTDQNLTLATELPTFEIYQVDSSTKSNPAEWITELYIPIEAPTNSTSTNL